MRILDRYLGRELLTTTLFAVATLSFLLVFGQIFKKLFEYITEHNTPVTFIVTFIAYALPASLSLTIPWGFLTAVLLVFGRLSANNELTAFRANGVSVPRVAASTFGVAVVMCGVCLWINLVVAPQAQQDLKDAFFKVATTDPSAAFSSDQVITDFPGKKIYVGNKVGKRLENIHVFNLNADNQPVQVVYAETGVLETDLDRRLILMRLQGSRYEQRDQHQPGDLASIHDGIAMEEFPYSISLEELYVRKQGRRRIESLSVPELNHELGVLGSTRSDGNRRAALLTEYSKRFSYALACLTFALVGVPLGVTAHRQETSIGFAISLGVAFSYYLLIIIVNTFRDKASAHPEILIWVPNVAFFLVGLVLFLRLARR